VASDSMRKFTARLFEQRRQVGGAPTSSAEEIRTSFAAAMATMPEVAGAQVEAVDAGGVPAEWTLSEAEREVRVTLLYLHGGGYFAGSPTTHRRLVTSLCGRRGLRG
jgi:monoterpene epsilon-lactone hydrolase